VDFAPVDFAGSKRRARVQWSLYGSLGMKCRVGENNLLRWCRDATE
jgi:hypothetical protein